MTNEKHYVGPSADVNIDKQFMTSYNLSGVAFQYGVCNNAVVVDKHIFSALRNFNNFVLVYSKKYCSGLSLTSDEIKYLTRHSKGFFCPTNQSCSALAAANVSQQTFVTIEHPHELTAKRMDSNILISLKKQEWHPHHLAGPASYWYRNRMTGTIIIQSWNFIRPKPKYRLWGLQWLQALASLHSSHQKFLVSDVKLRQQGIMSSRKRADLCFVVRTYSRHVNAMYTLTSLLESMQLLKYIWFHAYIINTDKYPFPSLNEIIEKLLDKRFIMLSAPSKLQGRFHIDSSYGATDWALNQSCLSGGYKWFVVTNGDNSYMPTAFNGLISSNTSMYLLNFYSRYYPKLFKDISGSTNCCVRLWTYPCTLAYPKIGMIDLGAVVFHTNDYITNNSTFSQFTTKTYPGGQDGLMVENLVKAGWTYSTMHRDDCGLHHNPNPVSCGLAGGIYVDSSDSNIQGCYATTALPISHYHIDWLRFPSSKYACICERDISGNILYLISTALFIGAYLINSGRHNGRSSMMSITTMSITRTGGV